MRNTNTVRIEFIIGTKEYPNACSELVHVLNRADIGYIKRTYFILSIPNSTAASLFGRYIPSISCLKRKIPQLAIIAIETDTKPQYKIDLLTRFLLPLPTFCPTNGTIAEVNPVQKLLTIPSVVVAAEFPATASAP